MSTDNSPFFIVGAPRSGTTLLRDILRSHPRLVSPEETFYFRWPFPFGTREYRHTNLSNPTIKQHRAIDGLSEEAFLQALETHRSRRDVMDFHGAHVAARAGKPRWFDKTPQNVYGMFLLAGYYPESKFVCIWRNPLNVAASLFEGRQIKAHTIEGAINYWMEAALIVREFRGAHPDRLVSLRYEDLTAAPERTTRSLLDAIGEDPDVIDYPWSKVHAEANRFEHALTAEQIALLQETTGALAAEVGYAVDLPDGEADADETRAEGPDVDEPAAQR